MIARGFDGPGPASYLSRMPHKLTLRCLTALLLLAPAAIPAAHAQQPPLPDIQGLEDVPGLKLPEDLAPAEEPSADAPDEAGEDSAANDGAGKGQEPQDRDAMLAELYDHLAKAPDAERAAPIAQTIEGLWLHSDSVTVGVLMRRAVKAINEKNADLAQQLLDA